MNDTQKDKINRFINDPTMSEAVYSVMLASFLKPRGDKDVQFLAASRIAIDLLEDSWKELRKLKIEKGRVEPKEYNIGV